VSQQLIAYEGLSPKGIVYSKVQLWRLEAGREISPAREAIRDARRLDRIRN
jgi:hypothetical protein